MSKEEDAPDHAGDFVIPGPDLPGGGKMALHHKPDHSLEAAVMYPLQDGVPIPENAVLVRRRDDGSELYDVEGSVADMKRGPSKVVTRAYRDGYDRVFGRKDLN
jgi:hypothetical protein